MRRLHLYKRMLLAISYIILAEPGYGSGTTFDDKSSSPQSTQNTAPIQEAPKRSVSNPPVGTMPRTSQSSTPSSPPLGQKVMSDAVRAQKGQGDTNIDKRTQTRSNARQVQRKGKEFQQTFKDVMKPIGVAGQAVGAVASATGDPHAKVAAASLNVAILAIKLLGDNVFKIVIGAARFRERSLDILSNTEVLIEDAQRSLEKIKILQNSEKSIIEVGKVSAPSESSSIINKTKQATVRAFQTVKNKIADLADPFTQAKARREAKLKSVQANLKSEKLKYDETIKLLQIKILQESVKEIDRKINVASTIADLEYRTGDFYLNAIANVSKNVIRAKRQAKKIREKQQRELKELAYYTQYQENPAETPDQLTDERKALIKKINELTKLTGLDDARYLQEKGVNTSNMQVDRATIVAIFREMDNIQSTFASEIHRLNKEIEALSDSIPD